MAMTNIRLSLCNLPLHSTKIYVGDDSTNESDWYTNLSREHMISIKYLRRFDHEAWMQADRHRDCFLAVSNHIQSRWQVNSHQYHC